MKRLFKKVIRDFFQDKRRTMFSLFAILIGTMSFGIVAFSYQIIPREINGVYTAINPASGSIIVDRIDDKLIELTNSFDGITAFEQKAFYKFRAQVGENQWKPLELSSAENLDALQINKVGSEKGSFRPGEGEILIERDAVKVAGAVIGDTLRITLPDGSSKDFTITGLVADIGRHPASIHDTVYAYVSHDTLSGLGLVNNQIDFTVTGEQYDREHILLVSNDYIKLLEQNGYVVSELEVSSTPGISMHLEEYEAGLFLLRIFSFVSFLFGGMIMSSLISSIISGQTRQIGILKGIGASTGKIMAVYMVALFSLIVIVTAISILLSTLLAGVVTSALMSLGNMRPVDVSVPTYLYIVYCGLALIVPMIIAYIPIRRGIGISVKDAINDYGVGTETQVIKLMAPKFLSRPILLSLRNALRRKRRFLLNVTILSIAGALFVAVITSMMSTKSTLSDNLNTWKFDYQILIPTTDGEEMLAEVMTKIPAVKDFEDWGSSTGMLLNDNGEMVKAYSIQSPPNDSAKIQPEIIAGRWLEAGDVNQIVVSHKFFIDQPDYKVGDSVTIQIGSQTQQFHLVGSMKDFGTTTFYISESGYQQYVSTDCRLSNVKLSLDMTGRQKKIYESVEAALKEQDILILQSQSKADLNAIVSEHYAITMQTFLLVACMLIIVSGFGLAATMNAQTSERIKEIGIMKAMGAAKKQIIRIITAESIFISLVSWVIAILLGIPLGILSVYIFGNLILETPLAFSVVSLLISYFIWLLLTFSVGYLASRAHAKRAANMKIRRSLTCD